MDNNHEHEADAGDVINAIDDDDNDNDDLFERIYLGRRTLNNVPRDVPFRLLTHPSVTEIHEHACRGCLMLHVVVLHHNVITIGRFSFQYCSQLQRVELPEGLLRLEERAFRGCTSLREIVIPASVQFVGEYACNGCTSLQRVVFAPRTTSIELGAGIFSFCSDLQFVTLPQNLQSIPEGCFHLCTSLTNLRIPTTVEEIGEGAFSRSGIQSIKILEQDEFIPGMITLPPNLRSISKNCFRNCQAFTTIQLPFSVKEIAKHAFRGSGLRSIHFSENVNRIGPEACQDCLFLKKVTFHSSTNLTMANNIFANCPSLSIILIYPWLWPKLFASMNGHPEFLFQFYRQYQTQIFDFDEPPKDVMSVRLLRRLRRDKRRRR